MVLPTSEKRLSLIDFAIRKEGTPGEPELVVMHSKIQAFPGERAADSLTEDCPPGRGF